MLLFSGDYKKKLFCCRSNCGSHTSWDRVYSRSTLFICYVFREVSGEEAAAAEVADASQLYEPDRVARAARRV